ncbi:MAG: TIGR02444 family protein [Gammaproteobacteria bacterium]
MSRTPFPDADTLWRDIENLYALDGAQARCLRLQDGYGLCITAVLASIALSRRGIAIHEGAKAPLRELIARWHFQVLMPLRAARRGLKQTEPSLHADALAIELAIERRLLDEATAILRGRAIWNAEDAAARNVEVIVDAHGDHAPEPVYAAVENLYRLLEKH